MHPSPNIVDTLPGEYSQDQHWTAVMQPVLQERMMRYETERLSFSLLALCGDSLAPVRQRLAENIRSLVELESKLKNGENHSESNNDTNNNPDSEPKAKEDIIHSPNDNRLATYQLDAEDIAAASSSIAPNPTKQEETAEAIAAASSGEPNSPKQEETASAIAPTSPPTEPQPPTQQQQPPSPTDPTKQEDRACPTKTWTALATEQRRLTAQYDYESKVGGSGLAAGQEPAAILGRTRDYTGAVHEWVRKLAERGVLRRLCEEVEMGGG